MSASLPGVIEPFSFVLKFGVGGAHGVGLDRLCHRELLFGKPAVGILAIERRARHGRVEPEHRIQRRDIPIGAERQAHAVIEKRAKRVGAAGAVMSDAALGPASVVDRVIGLHGGDHVQLREAVEIFGRHVLRVLDAEAAIGLAVRFHDVGSRDRE